MPDPYTTSTTTVFGRGTRIRGRRRIFCLRRRRKQPTARLGGEKKPRRRGLFMVKLFRRVRVNWKWNYYSSLLKKMKAFCQSLMKDELAEYGGAIEYSFQQRLFMEASFAVPVGMGLPLNSFHPR
ncbi:unnamed protein product [Cuscuta epithymum]|uniref:Uncharacterized protein n=1 Tax=Cuscuta epithymum TaxID=186058 RepID=A0AAV0F4A7_9ASTE|nr:unnamed protein product [Cuscuta epithymum]